MLKKNTVLVSGNFNILHPGHLRLLHFAKECGNRLIIAVESDRIAGINAHVHENLRLLLSKYCTVSEKTEIEMKKLENEFHIDINDEKSIEKHNDLIQF